MLSRYIRSVLQFQDWDYVHRFHTELDAWAFSFQSLLCSINQSINRKLQGIINTSYADPSWAESTLLQNTIGSHIKITLNRKIDAANCTHKRLHTCKIHINVVTNANAYNLLVVPLSVKTLQFSTSVSESVDLNISRHEKKTSVVTKYDENWFSSADFTLLISPFIIFGLQVWIFLEGIAVLLNITMCWSKSYDTTSVYNVWILSLLCMYSLKSYHMT